MDKLFPSEISGYLPPLIRLPFQDAGGIGIFAQPLLRTFYQAEELFGLGVAWQFGLAFFLFYPVDGVHAVAVDGHVEAFLLQQGQSVNNGQKFSDIIGTVHRPEVKDFLTAGDERLMYAYGEEAKAFSASSRVSNDLYFAPW